MASNIVSEPGSAQDSANFKLGVDAEEVGSESDSEENEVNTEKNSEEDEVQSDTDNGIDSDNADNVSEYRQALRKKFKLYVYPAKADGNCLFRSVAQQMYGDEQHHIIIREFCVSYMQARAVTFQPFVSSSMAGFTSHLQRMRKPVDTCDDSDAKKQKSTLTSPDTWGGEPEIKAMSELYQRPVQVFCPDDTQGVVLLNRYGEVFEEQNLWPIRLNFYSHGHYDSAIPVGASVVYLHSAPGELERRRVLGMGAVAQCSTAGVTPSQIAATFYDEEEAMDEILRQSEAEELEKQTQQVRGTRSASRGCNHGA